MLSVYWLSCLVVRKAEIMLDLFAAVLWRKRVVFGCWDQSIVFLFCIPDNFAVIQVQSFNGCFMRLIDQFDFHLVLLLSLSVLFDLFGASITGRPGLLPVSILAADRDGPVVGVTVADFR